MKIIQTDIDGLLVIKPDIYGDERGYFFESFRQEWFDKEGIDVNFIQDNQSSSSYGVVRGLHMQNFPYQQAKLVRVIKGNVLDVAVDLRKDSPTYGKHFAIELSDENNLQFFIPKGFAHGFAVLSKNAVFAYKCDEYYHPESEIGIKWNDKDLNIDWKIDINDLVISPKDQKNKSFAEVMSNLSR